MLDLKNKRIMIIVAHPDDELLGCGATMNKLLLEYNCTIRAVILGEGITSRSNQRDTDKVKEKLSTHKRNINTAAKKIGYSSIGVYDFPDNRFDSIALLDLVKTIEKEKESFCPEIIFTHHGGDLNIDHQRTFEAVMTACRPMKNENVKAILTFETPSGTEWQSPSDPRQFLPNLFFEISKENLNAKINGMECYEFEKRLYPHPRSPEALKVQAQRWGIVVGKDYVEPFQIIRFII